MSTQVPMYTLYGVELSLYSGKVRSYLRYKGVDWHEVAPTKEIFVSEILPVAGAPIIPVIKVNDGTLIQDSTEIIDYIEQRHPENSIYPDTPKQKLAALLLEWFGDEWLLIPAMHYRWSYLEQQHDFIMSEFGQRILPNAPLEQQIAAGIKASQPFRNSAISLGVLPETIPGIEQSYLQFLATLNAHFTQHNFLFGERPSIADYGFHGCLYAHLARDPYPGKLMREKAPEVFKWVERMNNPTPLPGNFLSNDEVPEALISILQVQAKEQLSIITAIIKANEKYLAEHPGASIPRRLGFQTFTIGETQGVKVIHSYSQWMYQRAYNYYHSLSGNDKLQADQLLHQINAFDTFQQKINKQVARKYGQLELVAVNS